MNLQDTRVKKCNVDERVMLKKLDLDPRNFLRINKDFESVTFLEVNTGKTLVLRR